MKSNTPPRQYVSLFSDIYLHAVFAHSDEFGAMTTAGYLIFQYKTYSRIIVIYFKIALFSLYVYLHSGIGAVDRFYTGAIIFFFILDEE